MACIDCGKQNTPRSLRCRSCDGKKKMNRAKAAKIAGSRWPAIPQSFPLVAPTMTIKELGVHFGKSHQTISRWLKLNGVTARKSANRINGPIPAPDRLTWGFTPADEAARLLSKFGPVSRCSVKGSKKGPLDHWRRGNTILTDQELIERAKWLQERAA